jgi:hypothetical protein
VTLSAPVDCEPDVALVPLQPPEAVHDVALVEDHDSVAAPPLTTEVGFALKDRVGAGVVTVTVTDRVTLPPLPVQLRE